MAKEAAADDLVLKSISSPADVEFFTDCCKKILGSSWKATGTESNDIFSAERCQEYRLLAEKGLLRSYVLIGNNEPWAFILGFQWEGVYHYSNIAFDDKWSDLSPGTVAFYLMLEDLHAHNKPDILSFGICDASYKKRFGTRVSYDRSLVLFRNNIRNKAACVFADTNNKIKFVLKKQLKRFNSSDKK